MSAHRPYYQERLACGCVVTREADKGLWTVAEQTRPCPVHIPGEWIATLAVPAIGRIVRR
jgi:hypothetical protein